MSSGLETGATVRITLPSQLKHATTKCGTDYRMPLAVLAGRIDERGGSPQSIVYVVDDDVSVRNSLSNLFRSVDLSVEVFGSACALFATRTSGRRKLHRPRHSYAWIEWIGFPNRAQ